MHFSLPIFLLILVLVLMQVAVGVVFGRCLPISRRKPPPTGDAFGEAAAGHAFQLADRLCQLVTHVAHDVEEHQTQLKQVNQELAAAQSNAPDRLAEFMLRPVSRILEVNGRLQARLSAAEEKLQEQTAEIESRIAEARTDPLTRLPNRRAFDDELAGRIAEWQAAAAPLHLMLIDVDHFKKLNDRHGHLAGDQALRRIAEVLRGMLPETDMVARLGGEQFAVILPGANASDARRLSEAVRTAVGAEEFCLEKSRFPLTISLGLASVQGGDDPVALLRRADEALYTAKRAGRNGAYAHNGQSCQRIQLAEVADNDLQEICLDLRQRVAQVTDAQR